MSFYNWLFFTFVLVFLFIIWVFILVIFTQAYTNIWGALFLIVDRSHPKKPRRIQLWSMTQVWLLSVVVHDSGLLDECCGPWLRSDCWVFWSMSQFWFECCSSCLRSDLSVVVHDSGLIDEYWVCLKSDCWVLCSMTQVWLLSVVCVSCTIFRVFTFMWVSFCFRWKHYNFNKNCMSIWNMRCSRNFYTVFFFTGVSHVLVINITYQ